MSENLESFEIKILYLAIRDNSGWQEKLRAQIPYLRVAYRKFRLYGFTIYIDSSHVPDTYLVPMQGKNCKIENYPPTINAIRTTPATGLVSFIIWLNDYGRICQIEACSFDNEKWPENPFDGFVDFQDDLGNIIEH